MWEQKKNLVKLTALQAPAALALGTLAKWRRLTGSQSQKPTKLESETDRSGWASTILLAQHVESRELASLSDWPAFVQFPMQVPDKGVW